jgi:hypothetical protein
MAKQKLLSSLFTTVSKEEMEVNVEREFAALNSKLELEKAMKKPEAEKRPVGRPKKEMEVVLLPTKARGVDSLGGVVYHVWPRDIFLGGILMAWTN